ncbi:MAG: ATP synthase F1 subunit gamma [Planctomycetes bacterium]|nr:ATP synthase F1 subunit gamma [Planctomycetota bacterium]
MANIKELRGRITSIGNISKITKAMEMVASMKLRKIQNRALAIRPYTEELRGLLGHLAGSISSETEIPLFTQRAEKKTTGIFVVSSDRGLCGAYNANVMAKVHEFERELADSDPQRKLKFYVYGKKGYTYLARRGYDVERFYAEPPLDALEFSAARIVGKDLVDDFSAGKIDDVRIAFTAFETVARFAPQLDAFLPVSEELVSDAIKERDLDEAESKFKHGYLLEPDAETLLNRLVGRYLETVVFDAMLESLASEMASRRMAMKGATDAADRMGKDLKKTYNRARQESITKELLDIVGGANAVS